MTEEIKPTAATKELWARVANPQTLDDALLAVAVEKIAKRIARERKRPYKQGP